MRGKSTVIQGRDAAIDPTKKIRVLVVDDAVVVRKIITNCLAADAAIEVAGTAANGRIALSKIPQLKPDLITLDIEMPEMDGLETLREVRKAYPRLPVIMFSTLCERGAMKTLEALSLGATDYVTKPSNIGGVSISMERIREELLPKVKLFGARAAGIEAPKPVRAAAPPPQRQVPAPALSARVDVVAIGISTGGPNALAELFPVFEKEFPTPIVVVQHMPPFFTRLLAERLEGKSNIPVREAEGGELLKPGTAWIAPGGRHLVLEKTAAGVVTALSDAAPENSCRPAVDVLFRSVAAAYGPRALAVVMTGMGKDGLEGSRSIRQAGGRVMVQDEASSVVWGMPGFVAKEGLADEVIPLQNNPRLLTALQAAVSSAQALLSSCVAPPFSTRTTLAVSSTSSSLPSSL